MQDNYSFYARSLLCLFVFSFFIKINKIKKVVYLILCCHVAVSSVVVIVASPPRRRPPMQINNNKLTYYHYYYYYFTFIIIIIDSVNVVAYRERAKCWFISSLLWYNNWIIWCRWSIALLPLSSLIFGASRAVHGSCKRGFESHSKLLFDKNVVFLILCSFFFPALLRRGRHNPLLESHIFFEIIKKREAK